MAEKNIKLKDGEDIVYPQTKIGNILNDNGSKFERYIDFDKYITDYGNKITQEGFNFLLKLKDDKNFIGIHFDGNNYNFIKYGERYNGDTIEYTYMLFSGKCAYNRSPNLYNGDMVIKNTLYINRNGVPILEPDTIYIQYICPNGTKESQTYLRGINKRDSTEMNQHTPIYSPVAYATQASNGYLKKINLTSRDYSISNGIFDVTQYIDIDNMTISQEGYNLLKEGINNGIFNSIFIRTVGVLFLTTKINEDVSNNYTFELKSNNSKYQIIINTGLSVEIKETPNGYGCMKLNNIKIGENKYSLHIYLLDYLYDIIINGASNMFSTTLTRDTFPDFVKTNITHELLVKLISSIIETNQTRCTMPYLSFDIQQTLPTESYMHNCSLIKEGTVGFVCGTNEIMLNNTTFENDFSLVYNSSFYGD